MALTNQEWLELPVKVASPNLELPVIVSKMALCFCGQPCICQVEDGEDSQYIHAVTMKEECEDDPRNDPPQ